MKISLSKMLPVLLLLVSFSAMSQDSLAINSKCDSLKAKLNNKIETSVVEEVVGPWDYNNTPKLLPDYKNLIQKYINTNYPQLALQNNISAKVILEFVCTSDGFPSDIKIFSEEPQNLGFGSIAVEALKQVKFKPARYSGRNIDVKMSLPIKFEPPKKDSE